VAQIGSAAPAHGERGVVVVFPPVGYGCTLSGRPGLAFRHDGQLMDITVVDDPGVPPAVVTLAPGQAAQARLIWNMYEGQGSTCTPRPTTVTVTPPGQSATRTVAWLIDPIEGSVCGGTVRVAAIARPA
jgi:hypothetical protein